MLHLRPATSSATLNALPRPRGTTLRRACLQPLARSRLDRLLSKSYAVRVLGDSAPTIQSVSDLNEWVPPQGQSAVVQVDGWVRNVRKASTIRFAEIVDGSSVNAMQAVVPKEDATQ
jgi:hypothetical protein